ncbi:MAG: S8 family serine peptidase [Actinomycetota bacterium]|nr:S8 family serine peptidase [Actinomycetota bacterium]
MSRRPALVLAAAAAAVGLAVPAVALAFDNLEPLASKQWYLEHDQAWTFWPTQPKLFPVKVAVIDSGIDGSHPEFVGRVVAARSFVSGSPYRDDQGHGTFVAGEIGANPFNAEGIAGLAFNAQLMIAKVVGADGVVSLAGEVAAIRWAADNGARVINLSLGGVRDPLDSSLDTYSPLEQAAVEYAYSKGAVVVAAVGNGPQSPATPWNFAHYPAALPHVIGVSAIRADGSVPDYSNRDTVYNDIAAPGDSIFSTIPQQLVEPARAGCADSPYSDCGPFEFRSAIGTSFAAPQVSAAAALLLGQDPTLRPEQVAWLLERSAVDATPSTGCSTCVDGRDRFTGWGMLDVANALVDLTQNAPLPAPDQYEPNDDAGPWAHALPPLPRTIDATLDYWDDNVDVYRIHLERGRRLFARVSPGVTGSVRMALWAPGALRVEGLGSQQSRVVQARLVAGQARLGYRAPRAGTYYLELKLVQRNTDPMPYRLALARD